MSTRSQIAFYGKADNKVTSADTFVYKHSDGYPEGVLPILVPFCLSFNKHRGLGDTSYATARCISAICDTYNKERKQWSARDKAAGKETSIYDEPDFLGVGVDTAIHGDIEFFYHVSPTEVKVYACGWNQSPEDWKLVEKIVFKSNR